MAVFLTAATAALGGLGSWGVAAATPHDRFGAQIVGGRPASESYSFAASLQDRRGHVCGATLIKVNWVVTARHCFLGEDADNDHLKVRVGSTGLNQGGSLVTVREFVLHDSTDLALVRLDQAVPQQPIDVADGSGPAGTATRILGWGQTCPTLHCMDGPVDLRELDSTIVADTECVNATQPITESSEICSGTPSGTGACYGDSGGPQIKKVDGRWRLVGAASRAGNDDWVCATAPEIYVDVPYFKAWIARTIGT